MTQALPSRMTDMAARVRYYAAYYEDLFKTHANAGEQKLTPVEIDGVRYPSVRAASDSTGIDTMFIKRIAEGKQKFIRRNGHRKPIKGRFL